MHSSSSSSSPAERLTSTQILLRKHGYAPLKTCMIPTDHLEVLCESAVDFENLRANGFQSDARILVQGWSNYLDILCHTPKFAFHIPFTIIQKSQVQIPLLAFLP